ncbi:MAG: thymidine kinase [Robiginitomaculum sp.]|nr:MAG: thymidine kinase [Robiginitomaculum sp.]
MSKLYFSYAAMNAGKSTVLLQAAHNYEERGMQTCLFTARLDQRAGEGRIASRIGIAKSAHTFTEHDDLRQTVERLHTEAPFSCVLVDEAQFLSPDQVWQLASIADDLGLPVLCYGLRTDFQGKLFPGSETLLSIADQLREIRTICWCGAKAIMVLRLDEHGQPVHEGAQVHIGGNNQYISLCRKHWKTQQLSP